MCLYFLVPTSFKSYYLLFISLLFIIGCCIATTVYYIIQNTKPSIQDENLTCVMTIKNNSRLTVTIIGISYLKNENGNIKEMYNNKRTSDFPLKLKPNDVYKYTFRYSTNIESVIITYRFMYIDFNIPFDLK